MTARRIRIGVKPPTTERWIAARETNPPKSDRYTARLTIDVTPELRSRIKLTAFGRGITVAEMLRQLLEERFPENAGEPS